MADGNQFLEALGDAPAGRRRTRSLVVLVPLVIVTTVLMFVRFRAGQDAQISDGRARQIVLDESRSDGLTFRNFVERRFARQFCDGGSIGSVEYAVSRMMGAQPNETILIDMEVRDPDLRCRETVATISAIKAGRSYRNDDDYRVAIPPEKWMDSSAQPDWLPAFRRGDDP